MSDPLNQEIGPSGAVPSMLTKGNTFEFDDRPPPPGGDDVDGDPVTTVQLRPARPQFTANAPLNTFVRFHMNSIGFDKYKAYIDSLIGSLAGTQGGDGILHNHHLIKLHGTGAYDLLRSATQAFLLTRCGPNCIDFHEPPREHENPTLSHPHPHAHPHGQVKDFDAILDADAKWFGTDRDALKSWFANLGTHGAATPYLDLILKQLPPVEHGDSLGRLYKARYHCPDMIELIWSYWHEEGMLAQTMNAIGIRFQNRRSRPGADPLASLETDPLRPLNNLIWGWIQSEYQRLTVQRRAYEYDHHYGLTLMGRAVPPLLSADSRSNFLAGFHTLLNLAHQYFQERSDTTRIPDGFPLLNALRALHLTLAEGAHNQFGDLPWVSRVEMLIEQWLLARPEMREFLRGRAMVPYAQSWMGQVDTMKKLQGWTDVSVTHFHELATCGEAILLTVRHGPWATSNNQADAIAWADYWRPEIQRYIYAYKTVTGADLTLDQPDMTMPAKLLRARLARQAGLANV